MSKDDKNEEKLFSEYIKEVKDHLKQLNKDKTKEENKEEENKEEENKKEENKKEESKYLCLKEEQNKEYNEKYLFYDEDNKYKKIGDIKKDEKGEYVNINLIIPESVHDLESLFKEFVNVKSILLVFYSTESIIDMSHMFEKCENLEELLIYEINDNTKNNNKLLFPSVKDMSHMFDHCNKLKYIFISKDITRFQKERQNKDSKDGRSEANLELFNTKSVRNFSYMFNSCNKLKNIIIPLQNNKYVDKNLSYMFSNCKNLKNIKLIPNSKSEFHAIDISNMFVGCNQLEKIEGFNKFNFDRVTNMESMFCDCFKLKEIDINSIITSEVLNMKRLFQNCITLKEIKFEIEEKESNSNIKEKNPFKLVKDMSYIFYNCKNIERIAFGNKFFTDSVVNMTNMFNHCIKLQTLQFSNFKTENVVDMSYMFNDCKKLKKIEFENNFDMNKVRDMSYMFNSCINLEEIKFPQNCGKSAEDLSYMFASCSKLQKIIFKSFDTKNVKTMSNMFKDCSKIKFLKIPNFSAKELRKTNSMFANCTNLANLELFEDIPLEKVNDMSSMFENCFNLTELRLKISATNSRSQKEKQSKDTPTPNYTPNSNNDTDTGKTESIGVENGEINNGIIESDKIEMRNLFYNCNSLSNISIKKEGGVINLSSMKGMFSKVRCKEIDSEIYNTLEVTDMSNLFSFCENLNEINLDSDSFNTSNVTNMSFMFATCARVTSITIGAKFDTSKVEDMSYMFSYCLNLKSIKSKNIESDKEKKDKINVINFKTENVTNMKGMFFACEKLSKIDISEFNLQKVENMSYMFKDCKILVEITGFNDVHYNKKNLCAEKISNMEHMFDSCDLQIINLLGLTNEFNIKHYENITLNNMFYDCGGGGEVEIYFYCPEEDKEIPNDTKYKEIFNNVRIKPKKFRGPFFLVNLYDQIRKNY